MTEHVHEWIPRALDWGHIDGVCCNVFGCGAQINNKEMNRRINEYEALKRIYRRIQAADHCNLKLPVAMAIAMAEMTALLAEEQASVLRRPYTQLAGTRKPMIGGTEITAEEQEDA